MPEPSTVQMNLAVQPAWLARLQYVLCVQALVVLAEALNTAKHASRLTYAQKVVAFPPEYAAKASPIVVGGINVTSATTWDAQAQTAVNTTTDAALLSQVATFWNALAGIETGS